MNLKATTCFDSDERVLKEDFEMLEAIEQPSQNKTRKAVEGIPEEEMCSYPDG